MPVVLTLVGILVLILLITYVRLDTFISFILVSIGLGLAAGMPVAAVGKSIQTGIGATLGDLILIMGFGAMLGKIVADSGAARRITLALIRVFGERYIQWGVALAGFIIGIPLFYNAGFIIVVPLIFAIASVSRLPLMYIAIPMCSALSVAHGYLPPHPSPLAISLQLGAEIGPTLLWHADCPAGHRLGRAGFRPHVAQFPPAAPRNGVPSGRPARKRTARLGREPAGGLAAAGAVVADGGYQEPENQFRCRPTARCCWRCICWACGAASR